MDEEPTTQELRIAQAKEEEAQRESERRADTEDQADKHGRRAEKAAYLKRKLEERAESERRAGG